jgi:D-alanine-D-alanine ligase
MQKPVAILYGGTSAERAVSCATADAVANALMRLQRPFERVDMTASTTWIDTLRKLDPEMVFIALHGGSGENGTVQAVLDMLGLPYNGSGVMASALAMDKARAKVMFAYAGLTVAADRVYPAHAVPGDFTEVGLALPVVVKPVSEGSSVGVSIVRNAAEWSKAIKQAAGYGQPVMVEEYVPGRELTVAVMNGQALAVTEILPEKDTFYNYESKYAAGGSRHIVPADLPKALYEQALRDAEKAHEALGCTGATRTDFRYNDKTGDLVVLELNTLPGMTGTSLLPEQAAYLGDSFEELVRKIVEGAKCTAHKVA